jgi:hypothetical protein
MSLLVVVVVAVVSSVQRQEVAPAPLALMSGSLDTVVASHVAKADDRLYSPEVASPVVGEEGGVGRGSHRCINCSSPVYSSSSSSSSVDLNSNRGLNIRSKTNRQVSINSRANSRSLRSSRKGKNIF